MATLSRNVRWLGLVGLGMVTGPLSGQGLVEVRERASFGGSVVVGRPVGEFQQFVDWGGGANFFGALTVARDAGISLRLDGSFLIYGSETREVPFDRTFPRVWVDMNTVNSIASMGLGPQLTFGRGAVTAYAYGLAGFSHFATRTSLRDADYGDEIASTTNFDDTTFAFTGGGGLRLRVSNGRTPISLDLGMSATQNGEAEYLREGGIREAGDGSVFLVPIRSEANLMTFKLGVTASVF